MTIKDVAAELGTSAYAIRSLLQQGKFPGIKRRRFWEVPANYRKLMNPKLLRSFEGIPSEEYALKKK